MTLSIAKAQGGFGNRYKYDWYEVSGAADYGLKPGGTQQVAADAITASADAPKFTVTLNGTESRYFACKVTDGDYGTNVKWSQIVKCSSYAQLAAQDYALSKESVADYGNGSTVALSCAAPVGGSSASNYRYEWYSGSSAANALANAKNKSASYQVKDVNGNFTQSSVGIVIAAPSVDTYYACRIYDVKFTNGNVVYPTFKNESAYLVKVRPQVKTQPVAHTECSNAAITLSTVGQYGGDGSTYTYQWERASASNGSYSSYGSASTTNTASVASGSDAGKTYYYRCVITASNGLSVTTNSVKVQKYAAFSAGALNAVSAIEVGGKFGVSSKTNASGGDGSYTTKYYYGTENNASKLTTEFTPTEKTFSNSVYITRWTKDGKCNTSGSKTSPVYAQVNVDFAFNNSASSKDSSICYGSEIILSVNAVGGFGKYGYKWYKGGKAEGTIYSEADSLNTGNLTQTTTFTCVVYDVDVTSNSKTLSTTVYVYDNFDAGSIENNLTVDANSPFVIGNDLYASGGNNDISYRWFWGTKMSSVDKEVFAGNLLRNSFEPNKCVLVRDGYDYASAPEFVLDQSVVEWGADDAVRIFGKSSANASQGNDIFRIGGDENTLLSKLNSTKALNGYGYVASVYIRNNHIGAALNVRCANSSVIVVAPGETKRCVINFVGNGVDELGFVIGVDSKNTPFDFTIWRPMIETKEDSGVADWMPCSDDNLINDCSNIKVESDGVSCDEVRGIWTLVANSGVVSNGTPRLVLKNVTDSGSYEILSGKMVTVSAERIISTNEDNAAAVYLLGYKADSTPVDGASLLVLNRDTLERTFVVPSNWPECSFLGFALVVNDGNNGVVYSDDRMTVAGLSLVYGSRKPLFSNEPELYVESGISNSRYYKRVAYDAKCNSQGVASNICAVRANIVANISNLTLNSPLCYESGSTILTVNAFGGSGE